MKNPLYIFVRFKVEKGQSAMLISLIKQFFEEEVSKFAGFISFKLHSNEDASVIINYATWESIAHFQKFVAFAGSSAISREIQKYHPQADNVYEIFV